MSIAEHSDRANHHRQPRSWYVSGAVNEKSLPPDTILLDVTPCMKQWETHAGAWTCDRPRGHSGRHYAGDGTHVLAVWS